jgi:hypothetical protein
MARTWTTNDRVNAHTIRSARWSANQNEIAPGELFRREYAEIAPFFRIFWRDLIRWPCNGLATFSGGFGNFTIECQTNSPRGK